MKNELEVEAGGERGGNIEKNVLVMKCNKKHTIMWRIPISEYWKCGIAGIVAKGIMVSFCGVVLQVIG